MHLLAIETSCDETAAAVIAETGDSARPWRLESNVVASQTEIHREWGGVVPEFLEANGIPSVQIIVKDTAQSRFVLTPLFPERIAHTVPYKLSDAEAARVPHVDSPEITAEARRKLPRRFGIGIIDL